MKCKYFALLFLMISTVFLGFTGCGINYDNLKVSVSTDTISIYEREEDGETTATFTATVEGATGEMLTGVEFEFKDRSIAKAEVISQRDNESTIQITALRAGVTTLRVVSKEYNKVKSDEITIEVFRNADKMNFRDQKLALRAGESVKLETASIISFEPAIVYPNEAVFTVMTPENALWNETLGTTAFSGVHIEDGVLYADENANCGIVQIEAKISDSVSCAVYALIYKDISQENFKLYNNGEELDSIKLVINYDDVNNKAKLNLSVNSQEQNINLRTAVSDDIAVASRIDENGDFDLIAMDSGGAKLTLYADLINPSNNEIYKSFSREYDIEIVRIAKNVTISSATVTASNTPVDIDVQDYYENIRGTEIHILVTPQEAKDTNYEIMVKEIDGSTENLEEKSKSLGIYVSGKSYATIKNYTGLKPYEFGELLRSDTSFYITITGTDIRESIKLSIVANTYDETLPVVSNEINLTVKAGVTEIIPSEEDNKTSVNGTIPLKIDFTTSRGENIGSPKFDFEFTDSNIAKIESTETPYQYNIIGLSDGYTQLIIRADNGVEKTIDVTVYQVINEFYLETDHTYENSNIVEEKWNEQDYINDTDKLFDKGVVSLTVKKNSLINVDCVYSPQGNDADAVSISVSSTDTTGDYIELSDINKNNKFSFYTKLATQPENPIEIVVKLTFNRQNENGEWGLVSAERKISITIYVPVTTFYWAGTSNQKNLTCQLYDKNSLNYEQQDWASVNLSVVVNTNASALLNGKIEWEKDDEEILKIVSDGEKATITAQLDNKKHTNSRYETYVYASIDEYGKKTTITCKVIVLRPQMVEKISVTNYNENEGIRLNDLGSLGRTQFTLNIDVSPKNAFNSKLGYKIYNAENDENSIPKATTEFKSGTDKEIVALDSNNPNTIIAKKAGIAVVRIYPLDRIIAEDTVLSSEWYVDVWVIVEDGNEDNPYSVYNAEEFMAIGSSAEALTKHYTLMRTIDISKYSSALPLGKEFGSEFSGSLNSYDNKKMSILGIKPNNTVVTETKVLGGLFGTISGKIFNINFNFADYKVNLEGSNGDIYIGLLAGEINGEINNVSIKLNNYSTRKIYISGIDNQNDCVYFGALAGCVSGNIQDTFTNVSAQINLGATKVIVGGLIGKFTGSNLGQTENLLSRVDIEVLRDNVIIDESAIGGLIGIVGEQSTVYSMNVTGKVSAPSFANVGGMAGINYGNLGLFKDNKEYKVLASVKVAGYKNVGGLAGLNTGNIGYARVENYEISGVNDNEQALASGIENIGGLVGYSNGGKITYSYAMSYVKQLEMAKYSDNDTNYSGDIIGVNNIGGLVGLAENAYITSSFAKSNIQVVKELDSAVTTNIVGGLLGGYIIEANVSLTDSTVLNCYSIGKIISNGNITESGELIGCYTIPESTNEYVDTCYSYVLLIDGDANIVRNLIGTKSTNASVTKCHYLADSTDKNVVGSASGSDMVLNSTGEKYEYGSNEVYSGWGFGEGYAWVKYDANKGMIGLNDNLPILYDKNGEWLYNQAITDIMVTALTEDIEDPEEGKILPTYMQFNGTGKIASVVVLENIAIDDRGERTLDLRTMFDISVLPEIDPENWTISVTSSNRAVVDIEQEGLNLLNTKLIFKQTGYAVITLQSLLDATEKQEILICVIGGFTDFDIFDEQDNSLTSDKNNHIAIKNGYGKLIIPEFAKLTDFVDDLGVKYSVASEEFFNFANYPFSGGLTYIPTTTPHLLSANATTDYQEIFATPYVTLNFGDYGVFKLTFEDLKKNFYIKIYNGITSAGLSATEANITSSEMVNLKLEILTDNTASVKVSQPLIYKNNSKDALIDNSEILSQIASISSENIENELITNRYILQLNDENRAITENVTYKIEFYVYDEINTLFGKYTFNLTVTPAPITRIDISHYTYGTQSMLNGEVSSNLIAPGTKGVLKVNVTPNYALFDYLIASSTIDSATNEKIELLQMVQKDGAFQYIEAQYNSAGNLIVQKITGYDSKGEAYFDGTIYLTTLVSEGLLDGIQFYINIVPMKNNESTYVFPPTSYNLISTFAPFASLTLDNSNSDTIARGTVANFRLQGTLFNSTIKVLKADYGMSTGLDKLKLCAFGDTRKNFGTNAKENVDIIIPFYVGISASPNNSKITVTIQIDSVASTGGSYNPLILEYTIYIVDYSVQSVYAEDAENGILNASIRTYTTLKAKWNLKTPLLEDFETYIGATDDKEEDSFNNALKTIINSASQKLKTINELGKGGGGVWWYNDGSGYSAVLTEYSYQDFIVSYTTMTGDYSYYIIKGKRITQNINFKLYFKGYYIYDDGCYKFMIEDELKDSSNILTTYQNIFEQEFIINVINNTTDDTPDLIDSVEKFRSMEQNGEGVSYMLTTDIVLDNWTPMKTAIKSLDGNGHIIYIRSFAENTNTDTANYGLFDTLPSGTVLKNLIIDVSHSIFVDLQNSNNVNFGFIAGVNDGGVIYNCDIVVSKSKEDWSDIYKNSTTKESYNSDFTFAKNIFNQMLNNNDDEYSNTLASTFILTDKSTTNATKTTYIGGIVGKNNGYITNCRVGRIDNNTFLGSSESIKSLQGVNLFASGNVGGLVGQNNGVISNSYFANGTIVNYSMSIFSSTNSNGSKTGGLVAEQTSSGRIEGSFAKGQEKSDSAQASLGGIKAYGTIGGLVHSNAGSIKNSYANMPLSSSNAIGGFVYQNTSNATIKYCYSMSKINNSGLINGVFVGIDQEGNVLNGENSTIENCYYLSLNNDTMVDAKEKATEISSSEWGNSQAFEGFVISNDQDSTWYIDDERQYLGPQLRLADKVYYSFRTDNYVYDSNSELGSESNPILIASKTDWENVFNYTSNEIHSTFMKTKGTSTTSYEFGNYVVNLASDISFDNSMHATSCNTTFSGKLNGNGYTLSGLAYRQSSSTTVQKDFGLFNTFEKASVTNLNLSIASEISIRARHIGGLAGTLNDTYAENITISGETQNSSITGLNMVGGLAGLVLGNSVIKNIESSVSVNAINATSANNLYSYYYYNKDNKNIENESSLSYAGGIIGVLDLYEKEDIFAEPYAQNLRTYGNVTIFAEISGGVIGIIGQDSEVKQLEFVIETKNGNAPSINGSNFAGGLVGENRGKITQSRIGMEISEQISIDEQISKTDKARNYIGYTGLFKSNNSSTAVGGLVGLNAGGWITESYSRAEVYATNAYIAGGIIGMAINAPTSYDPSGNDATLTYLRELSDIDKVLKSTKDDYKIEDSKIKTSGKFSFSATLVEIYTTGGVNGQKVIGGIVGAVMGAPLFANSTDSLIVGINNYDAQDKTFTDKLGNTNYYVGGLTGYLGYTVNGADEGIVPIVSSTYSTTEGSFGVASRNSKLVTSVNGNSIPTIGNVSKPHHSANSIDFLTVSTDENDDTFAGFNETVWNIDKTKTSHRFAILKSSYSETITNITTAEELFKYLSNTTSNSYGKITNDIVINGADWTNYVVDKGKYTIATSPNNAVKGRLEGVISYESNGQTMTKSATITLTNFTDQAKEFYSLFGYTQKFRLVNIDFVFDFSPDLSENGISSPENKISNFGLLAQKSYSTYFENISVKLINKNTIKVNNLENVAVIVGVSQSNSFIDVSVDAKIETIDDFAGSGTVNIGAFFGQGKITNTINCANMGNFAIVYKSTKNYTLNFGGLAGEIDGVLKLNSVLNNKDNLQITMNINADNNTNDINLGGIGGRVNGTSKIQNLVVSGNINLTRTNGRDNSVIKLGGIAGELHNSNLSSITSKVKFIINANNGSIYAGGIAGNIINEQEFIGSGSSMQFNGYVAENLTSHSDFDLTATTNNAIYLGGIFGLSENDLILPNSKMPTGQARNIYYGLFSDSKLNVESASNYIYIGGLIGKAIQGYMSNNVYTELAKPNSILRIAESAFVGDIYGKNNQTQDGYNYFGGIVGDTQISINDVFSNGTIRFESENPISIYAGGIVGITNNDISYSLTISSVQTSVCANANISAIGAVCGKQQNTNGRISNTYYSGELCGLLDNYATNLTAMQMLDVDNFKVKGMQVLSAEKWTYAVTENENGEEIQCSVLYPLAVKNCIDTTSGGDVTPYIISDLEMLQGLINENTKPNKIVIFNTTSPINITSLPQLQISNVRKIVGIRVEIEISSPLTEVSENANIGLFDTIPKNVVVSSITLDINQTSINTKFDINFGGIAGVNNGAIYNCTVGCLTEYGPSTNYASDFTKLRETYADKFTSLTEKSNSIFAIELTESSNSNIGVLVGLNNGNITASLVNVDLSVRNSSTGTINVGGLIGSTKNAWINNSVAQNRVLVNNATATTNVGGIAGAVYNSRFDAILANGNVMVFEISNKEKVGLAFGSFTGITNGVVVNSDLSGNININDTNKYYNDALTTQELLTASKFNSIVKDSTNLFGNVWSYGNHSLNYGYPYLNVTNIDMATGDGTEENPYQLREGTELARVTKTNAKGKYFVLVRDCIVSSDVLKTTATSTVYAKTLNGNGKVVIWDEFILPESSSATVYIGLFKTVSAETEIKGLGIVINNIKIDSIKIINFGGLASENKGTISNCAVTSLGEIKLASSPGSKIGGLVGQNKGAILNSWADVDFNVKDGYIGGFVGLLGESDFASSEKSTAYIHNCFANGNLIVKQDTSKAYTETSVGGLVGVANATVSEGYSINNCYVYGSQIQVESKGSKVGALIGNAIVLNTQNTYAFIHTPGEKDSGNYANIAMAGAVTNGSFDDTSVISIYLGRNDGAVKNDRGKDNYDDGYDSCYVKSIDVMRTTALGNGIYTGWDTSIWGRASGIAESNEKLPYLNNVTPSDKQDTETNAYDVFK